MRVVWSEKFIDERGEWEVNYLENGEIRDKVLLKPSQAYFDTMGPLKTPEDDLNEAKSEYAVLTTDKERIDFLARSRGLI